MKDIFEMMSELNDAAYEAAVNNLDEKVMKNWELAFQKNSICEDCGKPWNSEYHMSDECVNLGEDRDET